MNIHFLSPYREDKNIGKAINDAVRQLNPAVDDFIVLCDQDMMWLLPDSKAQVMQTLRFTQFDILGCMTNRVGLPWQVASGMAEEDSLRAHIEKAKELQHREGAVVGVDRVAAFMMCFRVALWRRLGGFAEDRLNFDLLFCDRAKRAGYSVGVMQDVYVLHIYRYLEALELGEARKQINHLL